MVSGWALRSNAAHTSCSFRSCFNIKQEPVIKPSSRGTHPDRNRVRQLPPALSLLDLLLTSNCSVWTAQKHEASGAASPDPGRVGKSTSVSGQQVPLLSWDSHVSRLWFRPAPYGYFGKYNRPDYPGACCLLGLQERRDFWVNHLIQTSCSENTAGQKMRRKIRVSQRNYWCNWINMNILQESLNRIWFYYNITETRETFWKKNSFRSNFGFTSVILFWSITTID